MIKLAELLADAPAETVDLGASERTDAALLGTDLEEHPRVIQLIGKVSKTDGPSCIIQPNRRAVAEGGEERALPTITAKRAVGCLVDPQADDTVLVAVELAGDGPARSAYVLTVLERKGRDVSTSYDGNVDIKVKGGRFRVVSQKGVDLVSAEDVEIVSNRLGVHTNSARFIAGEIVALGTQLVAEMAHVKLKGSVFDRVFERVSERVQRSFRQIEDIDQVRAKQIDYAAEDSMILKAENTIVSTKELVKSDADRTEIE